ncbi:MAG: NlpC/P60 family protein [Bacteroidota bacterium]
MQYAFCKVSISPVRKENSDASEMVSQLLFGEVVEMEEIQENRTRIRTFCDNYEGWADTRHLIPLSTKEVNRWLDGIHILPEMIREAETPWGKQMLVRGAFIPQNPGKEFNIGNHRFTFAQESKSHTYTLKEFALTYLNTPYLWGGKSPFGIDCSGFSQTVFRYCEKNIPRDAYQQCDLGIEVLFEDRQEGDLAFFNNDKGKITHVGIVLEDGKIIHASSWVRIDDLRPDGIYKAGTGDKTHNLFVIKRI